MAKVRKPLSGSRNFLLLALHRVGWSGSAFISITVTTGVNIATLKYSYSCFAFIVSNDIENLMPVIYDFLYRVHELLRHSFTNARFTGLEV